MLLGMYISCAYRRTLLDVCPCTRRVCRLQAEAGPADARAPVAFPILRWDVNANPGIQHAIHAADEKTKRRAMWHDSRLLCKHLRFLRILGHVKRVVAPRSDDDPSSTFVFREFVEALSEHIGFALTATH